MPGRIQAVKGVSSYFIFVKKARSMTTSDSISGGRREVGECSFSTKGGEWPVPCLFRE